ncbi:MAG: hypothetical protein MUC85_05795 [Anaerolineales bacterium]|jgi:hypothetical protein|nr:hypothetical protein [Anaerolineales bacterium]
MDQPFAPRKWPLRQVGFGIAAILVLGILGSLAWFILQNKPGSATLGAEVEACRPAEIPQDYEAANKSDLEGDLRRDSYFQSGEEYTIAPGATFRIPQGRTLIIQPGVRVRFGEGSRLVVEGTLLACGRASRRILFTADAEVGRPGFWSGIELNDPTSGTVLGHLTVEFAGKDNHPVMWMSGSSFQIEDVEFSSNQWYSLSFDPNSAPDLRGPFEVDASPSGWEMRGGDLNSTRAWDYDQTIIVNGVVRITEEARLTLPAGMLVKFLPTSAIHVLGVLDAQGTPGQKIVLTSVNDGGEEGAPPPKAGDWVGIVWTGQKYTSFLSDVEVRYAGGQSPSGKIYASLFLEDASPQLNSVSVQACNTFAISTDIRSSPQIRDLAIDSDDPLKRWELRESQVEDVGTYTLASLETSDGLSLHPLATGWVRVAEKATLIVNPGTQILFSNGNRSGMWVSGVLKINGTPREPVIMTSWKDPQVGGSGQPAPGDWAGLHLKGGKPGETIVSELIMRYAGAVENTCMRLEGSSARLENVSIEHCAAFPISSDAVAQPTIEDLSLSDNTAGNVWEIRGSDLTERRTSTWAPVELKNGEPLIRRITGRIIVGQAATLALTPGTALSFGPEGYLVIRGGIQAPGTEQEPILLTSWRDPEINPKEGGAQPGDWPGLALDGVLEGQLLQNVSIRYAGSANRGASCLLLNNASPVVDQVEISHCSYYPISSDLGSNPQIGTMSLADNQLGNAWVIRESTLSRGSMQQWQAIQQSGGDSDLPRLVTGWLTIDAGATLEIGPGAVVRFEQGIGMAVKGSLNAAASKKEPAILTSWRDPEFSSEGGVQAGDWAGLHLDNPQGKVLFDWVEIRFAGQREGALKLTNAAPGLKNLLIRDSANYPISHEIQSSPEWGNVSLINNSPANAVEIRGSTLERAGELIWTPLKLEDGSEIARLVTGRLTIGENATLRMDPETVVKFTGEGWLEVFGALTANQAVFTSFQDDQFGGITDRGTTSDMVWKGIQLKTRKPVRLQDVTLRFAEVGLWLENSAPELSTLLIEGCTQAAISADLPSSPQFKSVTFKENAINGMLMRATELPDGETRWNRLGDENQVVRVILANLTISPRAQLVIEEGTVIKFGSQVGLIVEGQLSAAGSEQAPVIFTALSDDRAGGDSDFSQLAPSRGAWLGISVNPNNTGARLSLTNMEIRYAVNGLFLLNMPDWFYDGLVIAESQFYGISCDLLSVFSLEEEGIVFNNNGNESTSCPTPDR